MEESFQEKERILFELFPFFSRCKITGKIYQNPDAQKKLLKFALKTKLGHIHFPTDFDSDQY